MKMRLRGNSIRLRISQSEMARLLADGRIEETCHFVPAGPGLTWVLEWDERLLASEVQYTAARVAVRLPKQTMLHWQQPDQVGIYDKLPLGEHGLLEVVVEKDFACLDLSDADNADTFPNPGAGTAC